MAGIVIPGSAANRAPKGTEKLVFLYEHSRYQGGCILNHRAGAINHLDSNGIVLLPDNTPWPGRKLYDPDDLNSAGNDFTLITLKKDGLYRCKSVISTSVAKPSGFVGTYITVNSPWRTDQTYYSLAGDATDVPDDSRSFHTSMEGIFEGRAGDVVYLQGAYSQDRGQTGIVPLHNLLLSLHQIL